MLTTQFRTLWFSLFIIAFLSACGGGKGKELLKVSETKDQIKTDTTPDKIPNDTNRYNRRGRVIDGYVKGATVWLDLNSNQLRDDNEPTAISENAGQYVLELDTEQRECAPYVATYVDIPVGAIDEDLGPVEEAYQMVLPPTFDILESEGELNITPLTTVLWQSIQKEELFKELTCQQLQSDFALRVRSVQALKQSIFEVVTHFNISENQLFNDYIANQDDPVKTLAEQIVKGLQASFKKHMQLKELYPDALEIRVLHYLEKVPDEDNHIWLRDIVIFHKDDSKFESETARMKPDLSDIEYINFSRISNKSLWGNKGNYTDQIDVTKSASGSDYYCDISELVSVTYQNSEFELSNDMRIYNIANPSECNKEISFEERSDRSLYVTTLRDRISYLTQINQGGVSIQGLEDWYNLKDKADQLDTQQLVSYFDQAGLGINEELNLPALSWFKRVTDDTNENRITTERSSDGHWHKFTYKEDGTHIKECSLDGINWSQCSD